MKGKRILCLLLVVVLSLVTLLGCAPTEPTPPAVEYDIRLRTRTYSVKDEERKKLDIIFTADGESADWSLLTFESKNPELLASLFDEILEIWNKKDVGYRLKCSAILYEILAECYIQNYSQDISCAKIQPSIEYIHQNYKNSDLTMKDIANKSFVSEVYFRKLFKEEYGISPQKYIINLRIQNAAGLISTGYYSLQEVAFLSGYNDYKYFSVKFKEMLGVSPSEYLYKFSNDTVTAYS